MQLVRLITPLLCLFITVVPIQGQKVLSSWKLSKQSDDIKISYRNLKIGDTLKTRQMKISFSIKATPQQLVSVFKDAEKFSAWSARIKACEIYEDDKNNWVNYSLYNIPWPFEQKDLVTEYTMQESSTATTLYLNGDPTRLPNKKGIVRMDHYEGKWVFRPKANGITEVEFYSISFSRPSLPRFIQDPVIQGVLIDSINKLKTLIATV